MSLIINQFGDRTICIGGVGKLFFQDGFPISMSVQQLKSRNIDVSILHVVDECLKNGWPPKTVLQKVREDFEDVKQENFDLSQIEKFCNSSYEEQREMIFNYLFVSSSKDVIDGKNVSAIKIADQILIGALLK